jgi:hypothetical protein
MQRILALSAALAAIGLAAAGAAHSRVTRFVVEERVPLAAGTEFGTAGAYERLKGTAYLEVDPFDPLNKVIVNLGKAQRNARGMVEFNTPFLIVKPVDMARGNQKIWYGVNNRGSCFELQHRSFPAGRWTCNPLTLSDVGTNNVLLNHGYTWVDAGWHGDGVMAADREQLFPSFPVAKNTDGSPIVGPNRLEYQVNAPTFTQPLVTGYKPYAAADTDTTHATLTVRDHADAPRTAIRPDRWAFGRCPSGAASLQRTATDLCLFDGFQPTKIYELVYQARDPIVMGLAYAVTRDIGSFLRFQSQDEAGNPNPLKASGSDIRRAYVSGTSSTGMYMREFLYLGFNEDEQHRKVFDGATIYSAATHRLFANVQFAHPTFYSGQDQHHDYTSNSLPPFTFAVTTDPITGIRDGILKRPATDPLVLQVDEEMVFWQWKASLNVVDALGREVPVPERVRLYFQGGFGHVGAVGLLAPPQPAGNCQHPTQGLAALPVTLRALTQVMDDWADRGIAPPASNYPTRRNGGLVTLDQYRRQFPAIPGLTPPSVLNQLTVLDFGPDFGPEGGVQTNLPPQKNLRVKSGPWRPGEQPVVGRYGLTYDILVPRPTEDGDGARGIDTIYTRAPLGTNVGWNLRNPPREPDLCSLSGSWVPLAKTKAERVSKGDSRLSLEERYRTHQGFVDSVRKAGTQLVGERFLLKEDVEAFVKAAEGSDVLK